ncbi:MAG: hypothetical protein QOE92_2355 [Chloroflexota bacterium]|nr:hypothetical protein [Chloroflexota bacterium]
MPYRRRVTRRLAPVLAAVAAIGGLGGYTPAAADDLVPRGELQPALAAAQRLGDVDSGRVLDIQLALRLRDQAGLDALVEAVSTPGSPDYGRYLTTAEFTARFGPTPAQVAAARTFLTAAGLEVTGVNTTRTLVDARGTASTIARALHTRLGRYRDPDGGREFYANDLVPALPAALAGVVLGVHGLQDRVTRHHAARVVPAASAAEPRAPGAGPAGGYTPNEVKGAYNVAGAPLTGSNGAGQVVGLLELDGFDQGDVNTFDAHYYAAPLPAPTIISVDGAAPGYQASPGPGQVEAELDIEVLQGVARDVVIRVYEAPNTDPGVNHAYSAMASDGSLDIGSTSWGLCEELQTLSESLTLDQIFQQAAAQGVSFYAASGDHGAYGCRPFNDHLVVDSPASDPYVVGVGGTALTVNGTAYGGETAWSNTAPNPDIATGGGLSLFFNRPSYQTGTGVINPHSNGRRQVPDVAFDADPRTGISVFTCQGPSGCAAGAWTVVAGTSAGSPGWAGLSAVYNQYAIAQARPRLGWPHPGLYRAAACTANLAPYHDVVSGSNLAYQATAGWDFTTGLGSPRGGDLAMILSGSVTPSLQVNSVSLGAGQVGDPVLVNGCGFTNPGGAPPAVSFGGTPSPAVTFLSATQLQVVVPRHAYGKVTVSVTNQGGGSASRAAAFNYVPSGYTLDGYGGVHSYGTSPAVANNSHAYWGWDIARAVAVCPDDNRRGYTLDGYGGVHPFGDPAPPNIGDGAHAYWNGWDIARGMVLTSCLPSVRGYTLDGWGGVHGFGSSGNPPDPSISGYWSGWDIAESIAGCPDVPGSGYTLDGYGGVHQWGPGVPAVADGSHEYWAGWNIARGLVLTRCASGLVGGYTLDGYGGLHPFGNAPPPAVANSAHAYWTGWDIARGVTILTGGSGGYTLDGYGGLHPFAATATPPAVNSSAYWPGWDIARGVGSSS